MELVKGDYEVIPGVSVKVTGGPSKGHQIVFVERGSERIAYVSDLIPTPHHIPLSWIPALDVDPEGTHRAKREFIEMAVEGGWLVIFGHGNEHRAGYIQQKKDGPKLLPREI